MTLQEIATYATPIILGIVTFLFGKRLREIESKHSKDEFIHQIRFSKEFEVYQIFWERLATLIRKSAFLITSELQNLPGDSRRQEYGKALAEIHVVLENNIPFLSPTVYKPVRELLDLIKEEISPIGLALNPDSKDHKPKDLEEMKAIVMGIHPYVKKVEMAIRDRIYGKEEK